MVRGMAGALFRKARRTRAGQGLVEYGLVLGMIAVVCIGALSSTGGYISGLITTVAGAVAGASGGGDSYCDTLGTNVYAGCPDPEMCAMWQQQFVDECKANQDLFKQAFGDGSNP